MATRNIVKIDEEKCDGCGQCATACAEGAIEIVDGKARLVSESYCDGLGACLGECPQDAITIEEREAAGFDEKAVKEHLAGTAEGGPASCPGSMPQSIQQCELVDLRGDGLEKVGRVSRLTNWPIQLQLAPPKAPYFENADLVIAADCSAFSIADFHERFLPGKVLLIACPKLDNFEFYRAKLAQIVIQNDIRSVTVVYMEVPCCFGLVHLVHESIKESEKEIPLTLIKVGIKGDVVDTVEVQSGGEG
ncbi:MAG: 4Fe-4S binding protein [Actinobacteria bacterium]|nr:4Fe-4S binding protein [Actinomycetota bacterium]MBU1943711.1 4Fe-4S binding protein [Actinomycetota bacterium]MBU2686145.1 4Fe-4S binding protein [Actinomycetota bacterium]